MSSDIRARFERGTTDHAMTVLHDDGLYRHLVFRRMVWRPPLREPQPTSLYWFDLVTVPGALIFQGDGDSYTFRRVEDMFEFFRGPVGRINPGYWAEKLTNGGRESVMRYDEDLFVARVKEAFVEAARYGGVPAGTGRALREQVLSEDVTSHEDTACTALAGFEHEGFHFHDTWEWTFRDYHWSFLWSLHAIVWGIAQYDAARQAESATPTKERAA